MRNDVEMLIFVCKNIMLTVVKRLLGQGYSFATVRKMPKQHKASP